MGSVKLPDLTWYLPSLVLTMCLILTEIPYGINFPHRRWVFQGVLSVSQEQNATSNVQELLPTKPRNDPSLTPDPLQDR